MYRAPAPPSPLVLVTTGNRIVAHDRTTGAPVWELLTARINTTHGGVRGLVEGDRVYVFSAGETEGGWSANAPLVITCLEYASGTPLWERVVELGANVAFVTPTVLLDGGQILVVCANRLLAFSPEDGTPQWAQPVRTEAQIGSPAGLCIRGATAHADRR